MSEFNKLYDDDFFIIDSNNLNSIKSKLYGFSILNNDVVMDGDIDENTFLSGLGSYIHIRVDDDKIHIHQDLNGSWGLYLFKSDDYFAISNSFLKLTEYLKKNYELSLNDDFAKALSSIGIVTLIYRQTLVNEIDTIPRNYIVNINKKSNNIQLEKFDYETHSIPLNSKEALDILDDWFYRWINLLRSIKDKSNNIEFNLSGGFDTRIILILALCANIDLTKIRFRTFEDLRFKVHAEDYEIATEIANEFNFKLNQDIISAEKIYFKEIDTILNLAFYIKLGFHNQLDYRFFRTKEPVYNFSGAAAEMMRTDSFYYDKTFDEIFDAYLMMVRQNEESFVLPARRILRNSLNELKEEFEIDDEKSKDLFDLTFTETRCRNHFGKFSVAEYLTNRIFFTPVVDPELHKLKITTDECDDKYLFYAVIFTRYLPKLLDFKIEGNREISSQTIDYAKRINKIKPFVLKEFSYISGPPLAKDIPEDARYHTWQDVDNYLKKAFDSIGFKNDFSEFFPKRMHSKIMKSIETTTFYPLGKAYPIFHVLKIINDIKNIDDFKFNEWISNLIERNHSHAILDINEFNNKLDLKADVYHNHETFSKEQIKLLQKIIVGNCIYKKIEFEILNKFINENDYIKLFNLGILSFDDEYVDINFDDLKVIYDDSIVIPFIDLIQKDDYFLLPSNNLTPGCHELCLKYKETYSEDIEIFVKDKDNLFDFDVWLGSDFTCDVSNFDMFQVDSISSTDEWSDIGERSVKVECNGEYGYQALVTKGHDVNVGELIGASVTVFNPEDEVVVRLFESSAASFRDVSVPASRVPKHITITKTAVSNRMQLLIFSRSKQTFYADNFVFTIN